MSDAPHLTTIIDAATRLGWHIGHQRPARTERGWRTAITGHKGFPDLTVARRGVVLFFEIKPARGYPSIDQLAWLAKLPNAFLVKPVDVDTVIDLLNGRRDPELTICSLNAFDDGKGPRWTGPMADWAEKKHPIRRVAA